MSLKVGIIGLPNVGKSTLFNAITNLQVEAANYPFATIEPNIGSVSVPDERLDKLQEIFNSKKKIATVIEFVDIAGLISGASKGEGLGNSFLSNIRETNAIVQVVRCFDNKDIMHVEGNVDPIRDVEIINLELILSDEQVIQKRLDKLLPKLRGGDKSAEFEFELLKRILTCLKDNKMINSLSFSQEEENLLKGFQLLTAKPFIYVANVNDDEINIENDYVKNLRKYVDKQGFNLVKICAKIEEDLADSTLDEKILFLNEIGASLTGLELLIKSAYKTLGLETYFTAGPQEVHSWSFSKNMTASQCAGIIHTDFERGFIKAEIYSYEDLIKYGNEKAVKDNGKMRLEGKKYLVKDGDICFFRFNL